MADWKIKVKPQPKGRAKSQSTAKGEPPARSLMKVIGRAGFLILFPLSIVAWVIANNEAGYGYPPELGLALLLASLAGLGLPMWMLGAIEDRLIELRESLSSAPKNLPN